MKELLRNEFFSLLFDETKFDDTRELVAVHVETYFERLSLLALDREDD